MIATIEKVEHWIAKIETALLAFVVGLMVVLAFVEVVLKLSGHGIPQLAQFNRYLVIWVGFLGGTVASYQARHINIDVVTKFVKSRTAKRVIAIAVNASAMFLAFLLMAIGISYLSDMIDADKVGFVGFGIPFKDWWFAVVIPFGLGLMGFNFLARTIYAIVGYEPPDRTEHKPEAMPEIAEAQLPPVVANEGGAQ